MFIKENIIALVTPYSNRQIDYLSIERYFKYIENQTPYTAVLVLGSTGDQHALSIEDKIKIYHFTSAIKTKLKIIYGLSSTNTANVIQMLDILNQLEAQNLMLGIPPYILPNQNEIFHFIKNVSANTQAKILLYNNFLRTGVNIDIPTINSILETCSNVIAVKEAGKNHNISEINTEYIYTGSDMSMINSSFYGCTSVAGNIMPYTASYFSKKTTEYHKELEEKYRKIFSQLLELGLVKSIKYHLTNKKILTSEETMLPILPLNEKEIIIMDKLEHDIFLIENQTKKIFNNKK